MQFSDYFIPFEKNFRIKNSSSVYDNVAFYEPNSNIDIDNFKIAIIGINENRPEIENSTNQCTDLFRKYFYNLSAVGLNVNIIDFGNLKTGTSLNDTFFALRDVMNFFYEKNIVPVFIGGHQVISYGIYLSYDFMKKFLNIVSVDSRILVGDIENQYNCYLNKILLTNSQFLFNFTNIGYQSYFQSSESIELLNSLSFDYIRLGNIRNNIQIAEPILRDADFVTFSMNAIKQSDAPAANEPSPNGFSGDEACQIARYIGYCDKVSVFSINDFGINEFGLEQTAHLASQMLWYFIEGFSFRKNEFPVDNNPNYKKFLVNLNNEHTIIFYKSTKTDRWWMEVPYQKIKDRNLIISCTYDDYLLACNHEIPDKWWKTYQKIN